MGNRNIEKIADIQTLLKQGFTDWQSLGNISVGEKGNLRLFNYTSKAQFAGRWNFLERVSRGLIFNVYTGEVVARPFDKFFKFGEGGRFTTASILNVTQKMDGSLGILYRDNGSYRIGTRGIFDSEQSCWATEFLNKRFDLRKLPNSLTLLFEIIYPGNRVVIDYQGKEDLVLLAGRNRRKGQYLPFNQVQDISENFGFPLPRVYQFSRVEDIVQATSDLDLSKEGWVAEFADGQRFKFKGAEYLKIHKLINSLSFKNTLTCVKEGTLDTLYDIIPDEFLGDVNGWVKEIGSMVKLVKGLAETAFDLAPKDTRKDFALWVKENEPGLSSYLFAMLDGKPIEPLVYRQAFTGRPDGDGNEKGRLF